MPEIDLIPEVLHQPLDPYNYEYDNLPLINILTRISLVNDAVDNNSLVLAESIGDQGTLSNRLAQSLNPNGTLITTAIDKANHNIAAHYDGSEVLTTGELTVIGDLGYVASNPVPFVRMLYAERAKLSQVAANATSFSLQFPDISLSPTFSNSTVLLEDSDTVTWTLDAPNHIQAHTSFPTSLAHQHVYDLVPVPANQSSPDYINYHTTSLSTAFSDGTLRVYVNGTRLSENTNTYVRSALDGTYALLGVTSNPTNGTFFLSRAINSVDVIIIDFDIDFFPDYSSH